MNLQAQVDQLVVNGDSSPAAAQASVGANGVIYPTLKARLDTEQNSVTSQLADLASQEINKGASLVGIHDADALFAATTVEEALKEVFTNANNGKADIASVIGAPANPANTFAQLKTHIQNAKNKGAANLTAKGTSAQGTETLDSLMLKIANVNTGKKWASGSASSIGGVLTVSGLSFKPAFVRWYGNVSANGALSECPDRYIGMRRFNSGAGIITLEVMKPTTTYEFTNAGFKMHVVTDLLYSWIAIE